MLLHGPSGSAYDGYTFRLDFMFDENYPFRAPKVKFVDKLWNPYVEYETGYICLDILGSEWTPALMGMVQLPLSILSLIA